MKSFLSIILLSLICNASLYCVSKKEQIEKKAGDKLKDAYVNVGIGGVEVIVGGYRVGQGDITGALIIGDGLRNINNGANDFKKACEYKKIAREMKNNE